jgi:hypothetical protein
MMKVQGVAAAAVKVSESGARRPLLRWQGNAACHPIDGWTRRVHGRCSPHVPTIAGMLAGSER